jgi:hypothetical protein
VGVAESKLGPRLGHDGRSFTIPPEFFSYRLDSPFYGLRQRCPDCAHALNVENRKQDTEVNCVAQAAKALRSRVNINVDSTHNLAHNNQLYGQSTVL